ncbi:MAG: NTP transferase domain-containing protein [Deltaproteobacteria bacterium]|nr:NTP transferase domain-containing protein [Deltaproteobacteria bacterium]
MTLEPLTAVVLAAGQGLRLGGPKALLAWQVPAELGGAELPLAAAHAAARLASDSMAVLVVVRAYMAEPLGPWLPAGARLVVSGADEALGPAGSLAAAVRAGLPAELVLITPVDCPPAAPGVVAGLRRRLAGDGRLYAARPRVGNRRGHPVLVRAALLGRYDSPDPPPLRELLAGLGERVADVSVDDPAVLADLDAPAELARWGQGAPRFFPLRTAR